MSAIKAAELWHAGQTTDLYSLLSTGKFHSVEHAESCLDEFRRCETLIKAYPEVYNQWDLATIQSAITETTGWLEENTK